MQPVKSEKQHPQTPLCPFGHLQSQREFGHRDELPHFADEVEA
jgi:hypothetical protein